MACSAAAVLGALSPLAGVAACKRRALDLPVTIAGTRPQIDAKINGEDAKLLVDSGAFFSMISSAAAARFQLKTQPGPYGFSITGLGGSIDNPSVTKVKQLTLAGVEISGVEFFVGGSEGGNGSDGIVGQNLLEKFDVEYDLAKGIIRLVKDEDCRKVMLAYWLKPDDPYTLIDIEPITPREPLTAGVAYLNGVKIRVVFDSGAFLSTLSTQAAERAGIKLDSPGVVYAGMTHGVGRSMVKSYIAHFDSFKFAGGEEIKNTRLRISAIGIHDVDMLLGADFFLSHRLFVATSQRKLYFTYNGGPVFNLSISAAQSGAVPPATTTAENAAATQPSAASGVNPAAANAVADTAAKTSTASAASAASAAGAAGAAGAADEPHDAASLARRGTAFAGRRQYDAALTDLTRAIELDASNPEYRFERASVYRSSGRGELAMADFNQVLTLKADHVPALMSRAELYLALHQNAEAVADLDTVDKLAAKQADVRYEMAGDYARAGTAGAAIRQLDQWIPLHGDDARLAAALTMRCRAKAFSGQDLGGALSDCNKALSRSVKGANGAIYDGRALVRLRLGDYKKAIADYDDALKLDASNAFSLYGRGIAKLRTSAAAAGEADIAAAAKINPKAAEFFAQRGIMP